MVLDKLERGDEMMGLEKGKSLILYSVVRKLFIIDFVALFRFWI